MNGILFHVAIWAACLISGGLSFLGLCVVANYRTSRLGVERRPEIDHDRTSCDCPHCVMVCLLVASVMCGEVWDWALIEELGAA